MNTIKLILFNYTFFLTNIIEISNIIRQSLIHIDYYLMTLSKSQFYFLYKEKKSELLYINFF